MNADGAFRMGKTHTVCQDYVLAQNGEVPTVLLADGCSSSPDTDIGARLLVRMAARSRPDANREEALMAARRQADALGLEPRSLDATLLSIQVSGDRWVAEVHGDGALAWADNAGRIYAISLSYPASYPHYLNYQADPARYAAFLIQEGNDRHSEEIELLPDGGIRTLALTVDPSCAPCYRRTGDIKDTRWVAILSDGVHSFVETESVAGRSITAPIPWHEVLRELLAFKNRNGAFVQRRIQRFLQQCEARHWQHRDDLSLGALSF